MQHRWVQRSNLLCIVWPQQARQLRHCQRKRSAPVAHMAVVDQPCQPAFVEFGRIALERHAFEISKLGVKHLAQQGQRQGTVACVQLGLAVGGDAAQFADLGQLVAGNGQLGLAGGQRSLQRLQVAPMIGFGKRVLRVEPGRLWPWALRLAAASPGLNCERRALRWHSSGNFAVDIKACPTSSSQSTNLIN